MLSRYLAAVLLVLMSSGASFAQCLPTVNLNGWGMLNTTFITWNNTTGGACSLTDGVFPLGGTTNGQITFAKGQCRVRVNFSWPAGTTLAQMRTCDGVSRDRFGVNIPASCNAISGPQLGLNGHGTSFITSVVDVSVAGCTMSACTFCGIGTSDVDCDGIPNTEDDDIDGDGIDNEDDDDMDGDGEENEDDDDFDGDGITNEGDDDMDGDGITNEGDPDMDGDGINNEDDDDMDGDGIDNEDDDDFDGDGDDNEDDDDMDGDGIDNEDDEDFDGDGVGNTGDPDFDGDGVDNEDDDDMDGDGESDETDDDIDGDDITNEGDPDLDGDGETNEEDDDLDGDGESNPDDDDDDGDGDDDGDDESPCGAGCSCPLGGFPNDHDCDGIDNLCDVQYLGCADVNADGRCDTCGCPPGGNPSDYDCDGVLDECDADNRSCVDTSPHDGACDDCAGCVPVGSGGSGNPNDHDCDGVPNQCDVQYLACPDANGNGRCDSCEDLGGTPLAVPGLPGVDVPRVELQLPSIGWTGDTWEQEISFNVPLSTAHWDIRLSFDPMRWQGFGIIPSSSAISGLIESVNLLRTYLRLFFMFYIVYRLGLAVVRLVWEI